MTLKDLTLMGLLGACGGLGVLSTSVFFAFIPFPGAGAILFMPLSAACLIIARGRVRHPLAAGITKVIQQLVIFFLPGGPPIAHNPLLLPLMVMDGFLLDGLYWLYPVVLAKCRLWSGFLVAVSGTAGVLVQVGILALFMGGSQFMLAQGVAFFFGVFVIFHSILRCIGGFVGAHILRAIPERAV